MVQRTIESQLAAALTALALVACGSREDSSSSSESESAIIDGVATDALPSVGRLLFRNADGATSCTATLIKQRLALTAAHCVTGKDNASITVRFGDRDYTAGEWVWSGSYDPTKSLGESFDIALLHLDEAVEGIEPMALAYDVPPSTEWFKIIGFGKDRNGASGVKREAFAWVSQRGAKWFGARGSSHETGFASTCHGDSGGPAVDSQGRVFGVSALVRHGCDGTFWYTRVVADRPLIEDTFARW